MPGLKRLLEHALKDKQVHNTMNMKKNIKRSKFDYKYNKLRLCSIVFCRQRLKCGVEQTTVSSQMENIGTGTKCLYHGQV